VLTGEEELREGKVTLKNMRNGDQKTITEQELMDILTHC
jgi:histidyl-tRNA synthetase